MLATLAGVILRTLCGAYGAVVTLREDGTVKDALAVFRLVRAPETENLTVEQAIAIVNKSKPYGLDPFDVWMLHEAYLCDDLDHAVTKALEMRALYANPPPRPN